MSSRLLPWKKDDSQRRASASYDRHNSQGVSPTPGSAGDEAGSPNPPTVAVDPQSQQSQQSSPRRRPASFFATSQPPSFQGEDRGDKILIEGKAMFRRPPTTGNGPSRSGFISRKSYTGTRSAPGSSHGQIESPPALTQTYGPVELPGSLLLVNEGFPSTDPDAGRLARWSRGPEKVLPSLAASLGLERPKAMTESPSITSRESISANSSLSNSTSPETTAKPESSAPQSPNPSRLNHSGARMASRPGFGSPKVISEAQRVSQVLARRVRDLETTVQERDESIKSFKTELEGAQKAHDHEMAQVRELHSTEIRSLKATFALLERNQQDPMGGPVHTLQTSSLNGSSKMNAHSRGDGHDLLQSWGAELEEARKSTQSASESMPSITVSEPTLAPVESIREEITLEFEKRLEGERRRRKEVLERAQDLHQSREAELLEKLDARDKKVCELEEEVAVWKDDVERVEESLKKFMRISEEYQAEAIKNATAKRKAEAESITLKETITAKNEKLQSLGAELEEANKRNMGHSTPSISTSNGTTNSNNNGTGNDNSNGDGSGDGNDNGNGSDTDVPVSATATDLTRVQQLEAEIKAHVEDIRLYKLDVRGYRKDVRSRDTKISYMAQHIVDLEKLLHARTTEAEDLRRRLMMAEKTPELPQQSQQEADLRRPRAATGLGLNLDQLADIRKGGATPDWPLPHIRSQNQNSPPSSRHTRASSSGNNNLSFSDHSRSENETSATVMFPPGFQSHVRPLSPSHAPRTLQQGLEARAVNNHTPTIPPKSLGRNKPLPTPKVNGKEKTATNADEQLGPEQGAQVVAVAPMESMSGQSWILD
ncbi:hypothetical protein FGG08_005354 [Glutinoglossum americanum]|uniref:Uncharacterized protein n=1 Tax=Glutinoglossum americanum TaxID=1670608 RepID=A0A9P8I371_9PEZI|nr:hypothetical protein FGG08_005354 [Glutinoglossum americanum]